MNMDSLERKAIRYTWRRYLLSNLDPFTTELVDELFEKDQISWEQYKRLREIPVRIDQVRELLTIVVENVSMSAFLDALDNTDNVFIADSVRAEFARINETRTAETITSISLLDNESFTKSLEVDLTFMKKTNAYNPDPLKTDAFADVDNFIWLDVQSCFDVNTECETEVKKVLGSQNASAISQNAELVIYKYTSDVTPTLDVEESAVGAIASQTKMKVTADITASSRKNICHVAVQTEEVSSDSDDDLGSVVLYEREKAVESKNASAQCEIAPVATAEGIFHKIKRKLVIFRNPSQTVHKRVAFNLKRYDAFVAHAYADIGIAKEMIKVLEEDSGIQLCIGLRNFGVGDVLCETILHAIEESMKVICICSNAFFDNKWCEFELHACMTYKSPNDIIIVYKDKPAGSRSNTLKYMLQCGKCLKITDKHFYKKLKAEFP